VLFDLPDKTKELQADKREAAQGKILAWETAVRVTNDALQIHGAMGYSRHLALERKVRDLQ